MWTPRRVCRRKKSPRDSPATGQTAFPNPPRKSVWARLFGQLANPLVLTLLARGGHRGRRGHLGERRRRASSRRFGDAIAILLIVILNAVLGFVPGAPRRGGARRAAEA